MSSGADHQLVNSSILNTFVAEAERAGLSELTIGWVLKNIISHVRDPGEIVRRAGMPDKKNQWITIRNCNVAFRAVAAYSGERNCWSTEIVEIRPESGRNIMLSPGFSPLR